MPENERAGEDEAGGDMDGGNEHVAFRVAPEPEFNVVCFQRPPFTTDLRTLHNKHRFRTSYS